MQVTDKGWPKGAFSWCLGGNMETKWEDNDIVLLFTSQPTQWERAEFLSLELERLYAMCATCKPRHNLTSVGWTKWKTWSTHKNNPVQFCHFLSVALVMEVIDSNYNQHLLLFQHIPRVKGNDEFPVRDNSDTDMNLELLVSATTSVFK